MVDLKQSMYDSLLTLLHLYNTLSKFLCVQALCPLLSQLDNKQHNDDIVDESFRSVQLIMQIMSHAGVFCQTYCSCVCTLDFWVAR